MQLLGLCTNDRTTALEGTILPCRSHFGMGVDGLPPLLKTVGNLAAYLGQRGADGKEAVVVDGGFLLHRMATRGEAAYEMVFEDDVSAMVRQCAREIKRFESRGIIVWVVFDGATPPAKESTGDGRRLQRERKEMEARQLDAAAGSRLKVNQLAAGACSFDTRTTARIATLLRPKIEGRVYIAPREADPQLVVFQDMLLEKGHDVMVYGNDSDLIPLGVQKLLFEITEKRGALVGRCIVARLILHPQPWAFKQDTDAHAFLRQLHGLPKEHDKNLEAMPLEREAARLRLIMFSVVAGNDFVKFGRIGPVTAARIVLTRVDRSNGTPPVESSEDALAEIAKRVSRCSKDGDDLAGVEAKLRSAYNMFTHPVVWDPSTNVHRHLSSVASSEDIVTATGEVHRVVFLGAPRVFMVASRVLKEGRLRLPHLTM